MRVAASPTVTGWFLNRSLSLILRCLIVRDEAELYWNTGNQLLNARAA